MRFVKKFTPPDFQVKDFTLLISLNFYSFSDKNTKKWLCLEKFTPRAKNFTLPAAVTAVTNFTSVFLFFDTFLGKVAMILLRAGADSACLDYQNQNPLHKYNNKNSNTRSVDHNLLFLLLRYNKKQTKHFVYFLKGRVRRETMRSSMPLWSKLRTREKSRWSKTKC